jgi:hypothetical protein
VRSGIIDAALEYASRGLPVHPLRGKVPFLPRFGSTTDETRIREYWSSTEQLNIGMPTGKRSGFIVIDIDDEAKWSRVLAEAGYSEPVTLTVRTGGGGRHLIFRLHEDETFTNHSPWQPGVDVRGEGGQVVLPPSIHSETAKTYKFDLPKGRHYYEVEIADLPRWIAEQLRSSAHVEHEQYNGPVNAPWGEAARNAELERVASTPRGNRNNVLFEAACNVSEIANAGHLDWSTAQSQLVDAALSVGLAHESIVRTIESARQKTGDRARGPERADWSIEVDAADSADDDETSSWIPVDPALVLAGAHEPIAPSMLAMTNGERIIYPAVVHSFHGESESLKTWLCLAAVVQELTAGSAAAYLDFEMTAEQVFGRLQQLGVSAEDLGQFLYSAPSEPLTAPVRAALLAEYVQRGVRLVIIDGMTEALAVHGLDLVDNKATAVFHNLVTKPLKAIGAGVVVIDHVLKDRERRVRGPIGAQHKLAGVDVGITVERVSPFAPGGHRGRSMLVIDKDRHGQLRRIAKDAKHLGDLVLTSRPGTDRIEFEVVPALHSAAGDDSNVVAVDFSFANEMDRLCGILN